MKKKMIIVAMTVCCMAASAQNEVGQLTLQPKVGLNLANLTSIEVITYAYAKETESGKFKADFALGVEAEYGLAERFSVAAGVLYSRQGTDFGSFKVYGNSDGSVSEGWDKNQYKLGYLNIPIVANYYFAKGWAVKAGFQPGFLLSAKKKVDGLGTIVSEDTDFKDASKSFDFSIPLGLSFETNNIVIDGRYNLGLTKVNKNGDKSHKNSVIQLTVGYKFAL
jgi:hypothetical protein